MVHNARPHIKAPPERPCRVTPPCAAVRCRSKGFDVHQDKIFPAMGPVGIGGGAHCCWLRAKTRVGGSVFRSLDSIPGQKIDLNVAVIIPDSARNLTTAYSIHKLPLDPAPYGKIFAEVVADRFPRLFRKVSIVGSLPAPRTYGAVFEASITEVRFSSGSSGVFATVRGHLRALNEAGAEVWRSRGTKAEYQITATTSPGNYGWQLGGGASAAIGTLLDGWTRELIQLDRRQYVIPSASPGPMK